MKIVEILATKYVHPDVNRFLKKYEKQAKNRAPMGYHSSMSYPYRVETKEAPPGTYFTKTGNLVKGRLTKAAKAKGARETDPKDSQRSKVPPVTQSNEARGTCWHGYQQKGYKKKGNKMVPNCVKEEENTSQSNEAKKWSNKYKKSINCANPKGFSQKAHCAGRKKK